jgi:hypothetical protein
VRNTRNLVLVQDAKEIGRVSADVRPHINLEVPVSGLSGIQASGTKCEHGMYIPSTSPYPDHSEYCSVCRPFVVEIEKGKIFKA